MTPEAFDAACRALPGVTMDIQWGADHVYKVGGKMFAVCGPTEHGVSLKVSDIAFEALVESGAARPAPYLARARWVRFDSLAAQDDAEMAGWLANAHALVAAKLTKAARRSLGLMA
jgi:predicted DNA-binding protein (MmcQ/YjbR family)